MIQWTDRWEALSRTENRAWWPRLSALDRGDQQVLRVIGGPAGLGCVIPHGEETQEVPIQLLDLVRPTPLN